MGLCQCPLQISISFRQVSALCSARKDNRENDRPPARLQHEINAASIASVLARRVLAFVVTRIEIDPKMDELITTK